jgi:fatty acid desaturase
VTIRRVLFYLSMEFIGVVVLVWSIQGPIVVLMLCASLLVLIGRHAHVLDLLHQDRAERAPAQRTGDRPDTKEELI